MNVAIRLLAVAAVVVGAAGCGEESEAEVDPPREVPHEVPELPAGWTVSRNDSGGFALGVPPGWQPKRKGTETVLNSGDRLAVVTVKPDRSNEALEADLAELADATGVEFGNSFQEYRLGDTQKFRHRYEAYLASAEGTDDGVRQQIDIYLLRRGELVTFTVLAQLNSELGAAEYEPVVDAVVRTIRSRPVGGYSSRSG